MTANSAFRAAASHPSTSDTRLRPRSNLARASEWRPRRCSMAAQEAVRRTRSAPGSGACSRASSSTARPSVSCPEEHSTPAREPAPRASCGPPRAPMAGAAAPRGTTERRSRGLRSSDVSGVDQGSDRPSSPSLAERSRWCARSAGDAPWAQGRGPARAWAVIRQPSPRDW